MFKHKFILFSFLGLVLLAGLAGCGSTKKKTNWSVNFSEKNKDPFGLYLAYESLPFFFSGSKCTKIDATYKFTDLGRRFSHNSRPSLVIVVGQSMDLVANEADSIIALAARGHQVLLAVSELNPVFLNKLKLNQVYAAMERTDETSCMSVEQSQLPARDFCVKGFRFEDSFLPRDTSGSPYYTIGTNTGKNGNYIAYNVGSGRIFLHASPFVFSNFFLLQNNNKEYLRYMFSYIPQVSEVVWMSFNHRVAESESAWDFFWRNRGTRWFSILAFLTLVTYVLFELKRKQKIIPVLEPNVNSSVAFVETIGRLYFNKGNHRNLAEKMIQHFLEFVRSNYYLNTNNLDPEFESLLAAKSGQALPLVQALVYHIKEVQKGTLAVDDAFLFTLYQQTQQFYHKR